MIALHARQTKAQVQQTEIMQKEYELMLAEHNAHYGDNTTVNKGVLVHKGHK
jgi:hypothetical protein